MKSINAPYGRWESATPAQVTSLFSAMPCPWWVAGGYAIELAVGHRVRGHDDIDVMMLRPDQHHLHDVLHDWECWAADPPGVLRPWGRAEILPPESLVDVGLALARTAPATGHVAPAQVGGLIQH